MGLNQRDRRCASVTTTDENGGGKLETSGRDIDMREIERGRSEEVR